MLLCATATGCTAETPAAERSPADVGSTAIPAPTLAQQEDFDGRILTRAGSSPFTGAVVSTADGRDLVLQISRLPTGGSFPVCAGVRWKPMVEETAADVIVTLAGYAPRNGSGVCADGLGEPVPFPVSLSTPLGTRRLVDGSDGTTHLAFDSASMPVPDLTTLPSGVQEQPVRWDETTRVAFKRWQTPSTGSTSVRDVRVSIGLRAAIEAGAPVPSRASSAVPVGDVTGTVWHGGGPYDVVVVRFPRAADTVEVRTVRERTERGTVDAALRIARSIE